MVNNKNPQVREDKQLHGTMRALIANMVEGVSKGFEKKFEIYGTGYTVKEQGGKIVLQVGFANPGEMEIPKGVKVTIDVAATRGNERRRSSVCRGADQCVLDELPRTCARSRPPEPYKGKGIRYADEVERKVGKAFTSGAA